MSLIILPIIFLFVCIVLLGFEIFIGVYVYRDAAKRGMNALLWTLVAVLAPSLIGFIIYLVVRGNYSDLKCPECAAPVKDTFVVCPKCGVNLRPSCPNCAAPAEEGWKVCPKCTKPLPEQYSDIRMPQQAKDKILWKLLIILLVVPVLLIALLVGSVVAIRSYTSDGGHITTMSMVSLDTLYEAQDSPEIRDWLASCHDNGTAYALRYVRNLPEGERLYYYLLYVRTADMDAPAGFGFEGSGFSKGILKVELETGNGGQDFVYCIASSSDKRQEIEVYLDGKKLDCEVTDVDFNPVENLLVDETAFFEIDKDVWA